MAKESIKQLKEEIEFLTGLKEALDDVKNGRISEFKFED